MLHVSKSNRESGRKEKRKMEKMYKIYYGENKNDYIRRYLKDDEIIDGRLSEAKAFEIFFSDMIMCNDYLKHRYDNIDELISAYDEEEDYDIDEYQFFIVDPAYNEEITKQAVEKMGNTLYYDNDLDLYITGITDLGTIRTSVATDLTVESEDQQ